MRICRSSPASRRSASAGPASDALCPMPIQKRRRRIGSLPRSSPGPSPTRAWRPFGTRSPTVARALAELCRDDAPLTLATAHGTKGLEFDHVAVIGMDAGRFPSRRSVAESPEPERALEEERRLAYVAWTRARRSLTLVYDPLAPSEFLLEAFTADELGVEANVEAA